METMNERIKALVKESGKTQAEIAKNLNISQPAISNIMSGTKNPSDRTMVDIAALFGVNLEWLKTGKGPKEDKNETRDEIVDYLSQVSKSNDPYRDAVISALSKMPPKYWEVLSDIAQRMVEAAKKSEEKSEEE